MKRESKNMSNRAGGCGGCGGCNFIWTKSLSNLPRKVQPPQPPQPPARFDTFFEPLLKHFPKTVSRILEKGPTKLASKSIPSANTLALSAPHSRAIYGSGTPYTVSRDADTHAMHERLGSFPRICSFAFWNSTGRRREPGEGDSEEEHFANNLRQKLC